MSNDEQPPAWLVTREQLDHVKPECESRPLSEVSHTEAGCRLFVGGLHPMATESELCTVFSPYGILVSQSVVRSVSSGESRGFGYVSFLTPEPVNNLHGVTLKNPYGVWTAKRALDRHAVIASKVKRRRVFISCLPISATRAHVQCLVEPFGPVMGIFIPHHIQGRTKIAFVTFRNVEKASEFLQYQHKILGVTLRVSFAHADTPGAHKMRRGNQTGK
eukprot:gnl/Dysnectes_brevis/2337_a2754_2352.p1 GENE.gnl/Dysnectes_brevis/2337_a2754_2352~~gnl/Dysnectes_brevis/2337_a2754_2352.p1  ORF type:complete len:218 (+),score=20.69 gnl/Dysnectes_brevis/2337_a2754_2352:92-745(+)